jgi:hypothetical protein
MGAGRGARAGAGARRARAAGIGLLSLALAGGTCVPDTVREPRLGRGLRAATCMRVITPVVGVNHTDPIYIAGFDTRPATGVHDDLYARGFVLERGGTKIAVVVLDLIGYFFNEIETARSLVDPALGIDAVAVASTHNHEGPDTLGIWGPSETETGVDTGYLDFVNDQIAACVEEANAGLRPAAIKFATGSTAGASAPPWPDLVADGHVLEALEIDTSPFGGGVVQVQGDAGPIINPSVPALQIRERVPARVRLRRLLRWARRGGPKPDLSPLGPVMLTLANYASHPESIGASNTLVSADFPGPMREALEAAYGGMAIYLSADLGVLQGPLDVDLFDTATPDPDDLVPRRTFEFAEEMGRLLAERTAAALDAVHEWDGDPEIESATRPLLVAVENPFFQLLGGLRVFGRRMLVFSTDPPSVESEAQVVRIGAAQLAFTPNELDPQIGELYRALMTGAEHRFVAGLGNDELGYQMPAAKFNPSCHLCWEFVLAGNEDECPLAATLDCGTVFINNIGPAADGLLQSTFQELIAEVN